MAPCETRWTVGLVIEFQYVIQPNRTPDFSGFAFPGMDAEGTGNLEEADR
jgi:hypothetical protein